MNLLLGLAAIHLPARFARRRLNQLIAVTAAAFGTSPPDTRSLSYREALAAFAEFSRDRAQDCLGQPSHDSVQRRLFVAARDIGTDLRREFRVSSGRDVTSALAVAYRALGIRFAGSGYGEVAIHQCLFSSYYSGPVCRVMQALDQGLAAGLSQGGSLTFSSRITDGSLCCRAVLAPPPAG